MNKSTALLPNSTADKWDQAMYAFLAAKQRRSGSNRTVQGYLGMLRHFFGTLGRTPGQRSRLSRGLIDRLYTQFGRRDSSLRSE